ncbi:glycine betaine ABC transporter substrate-binding protein [Nocardiopsis baichengensis]|uniref:glycine betaine ABC transporter substrate-binding protein n=1 Tax=Nocardiopsis baichengensis TaxID=280240 RepID=UPI000345201A|nr:glycine betaine ABC transporter substrate-binding protein [Nocardiopsis baichengensis]
MRRTTSPISPRTASFALKGVAAASAVAMLSACGGATSGDVSGSDETVNIAVNGWVGYEASAAVLAHLLEEEAGVKVEQKKLDEQPSWQGLNDGDLDVIVENWGHEDLMEQYGPDGNDTVVDGGPNGNIGTLGWYVPEYLVDDKPELATWEGIKDNTDLFQTPESGDKGEFLAADPAFVTQDQGMINHFEMDLEIVHAGSEAAQITEMQERYEEEEPFLAYFYDPQWLHNELDLVHVEFPEYEDGCAEDEDDVSCGYPEYDLNKIFRKDFAEEGSVAYQLLDNWKWTNEDQNAVAKMIADEGMDPEEAAEKWVTDNGDVWKEWIPADA